MKKQIIYDYAKIQLENYFNSGIISFKLKAHNEYEKYKKIGGKKTIEFLENELIEIRGLLK